MAMPSILIIGSLNTDLVTNTPRIPCAGETLTASSFSTGHGGKGANQAVACARLSRHAKIQGAIADVKMIGCVGNDEFGTLLKEGLEQDDLDVTGIEIKDNISTGVAVILVEPNGENRILITPGANGLFVASAEYLQPIPDLLIMQLEVPLKEVLQMLEYASNTSPPTEVLVNPAPAVELPDSAYSLISHLIVNESEATVLARQSLDNSISVLDACTAVAEIFVKKGVTKTIVITLGSQGAFWYDVKRQKHGLEDAKKVDVVDTTAAGDTFVGGFAVSLVSGASISNAVKWATAASAVTVTRKGAQDAIPWRNEINEI